MRVKDIFTPGSYPEHTFINEHIIDKQRHFLDALEMGSGVISISGPSKSGKTVFVENLVGKEHLVHVTGAGVDIPEKLWERVFDKVGTPIRTSRSATKANEYELGGKVGGEAGIFVKGTAEVTGGFTHKAESESTAEYSADYLNLLVKEFGETEYVIFIDDFHYISESAKHKIAEVIKEAARQHVRFVCAAVPYRADDVIRANPDLRGRLTKIDLDYWTPDRLFQIAEKGFGILEIDFDTASLKLLAEEAAGSPQLMQALCLNACFEAGIREKPASVVTLPHSQAFLTSVCSRTSAMSDHTSVLNVMKEGPKSRGQARNAYTLKSGETLDVYPIIVRAISLDPPELTFRYQNLLDRICQLCKSDAPSGSSVTGSCSQIALLANATSGYEIIEWDADHDVLDLRDPYLLFFIRWS